MSATLLPAPEVPFFPPLPLRIADFDGEYFAEENGAVLMPGQTTKATSLADVLHNPSVPVLAFTAALYQELRYLAVSIPTEWAVFLLLKKLSTVKPHFLAFDWFMTDQRASGGEVSMDADDARRYYRALEETPYYKEHGLHRHLCHLHSHAKMSVFFSSIDHEQQTKRDELGFYDDFRFYVVVNAQGEIKVTFVTYFPVLGQFEGVPALVFSKPEYVGELTAERKRDIDARVAALVRAKNPILCQKNDLKGGKKQTSRTGKKDKNVGRNARTASETPHLFSSLEEREELLHYISPYAEKKSDTWKALLPGPAFGEPFDDVEDDDADKASLRYGAIAMAMYLNMKVATDRLYIIIRAMCPVHCWNILNEAQWDELAAFLDLVAALHKSPRPIPLVLQDALLRFARYIPDDDTTVGDDNDDFITLLVSAATHKNAYDTHYLYTVIFQGFFLICRQTATSATDAQAEALC